MSSVLEDFIPNDVATLRRRAWPIVQTTVAATAAWQISLWLLPASAPTYAILAVVTGMNVHPGNRGKWMLQVTLGAILGVLIANAVGRVPAPVTVQILLAVFLTLAIGVLFYSQNWFLINAAAGGVTPIAHGAVDHGFTFTVGWQALIACGVALAITQLLFPADAAATVRGQLASVLSGAGQALRTTAETLTGRTDPATRPGRRPDSRVDESLDSQVSALRQVLQEGEHITRLAPRRFSQRPVVARYNGSHPSLARLADDLGGLTHLAERADDDDDSRRALGRLAAQLGGALDSLAEDVDDPTRQDALARCAQEITRLPAPGDHGSARLQAVAIVLRNVARDAFDAARALQPEPGR